MLTGQLPIEEAGQLEQAAASEQCVLRRILIQCRFVDATSEECVSAPRPGTTQSCMQLVIIEVGAEVFSIRAP